MKSRLDYMSVRKNGSAMIMTIVVALVLGLAIFFSLLQYTKELGAFQEQKSAIDVASLAAARALSKVVVEIRFLIHRAL